MLSLTKEQIQQHMDSVAEYDEVEVDFQRALCTLALRGLDAEKRGADGHKACRFCGSMNTAEDGGNLYPINGESKPEPGKFYRAIYCWRCEAKGPEAQSDIGAWTEWDADLPTPPKEA